MLTAPPSRGQIDRVVTTFARSAPGLLALVLLAPSAAAQSPPAATAATPASPAASPAAPAATAVKAPAAPAWKAPARLPKLPPPPPPPDVPARLWIIAPGPREAWTMRIDNEGDKAIRIPADVRLLSFEIEVPSNDPKNPRKKPTTYKCAAPDSLRPGDFPERRALLLSPGQSYIEQFDPRLFCFGKNAAGLVGTAIVRARFGWDPPPKWSLAAKKPPAPPFAAEGTDNPATTTPLRQLRAPTLVLSFGTPPAAAPAAPSTQPAAPSTQPAAGTAQPAAPSTQPAAGTEPSPAAGAQPAPPASQPSGGNTPTSPALPAAGNGEAAGPAPQPSAPAAAPPPPPPPVDANAPRLAVEVPAYVDASAPRNASITVTVKNAGGRPMLAALRPRMLAFEIAGPDRTVTCPAWPPTNAVPREGYRQYKPGGSTSFTVLLEESCPQGVFTRPGLYRVSATMDANEPGTELDLTAFTGKGTTAEPALLRLQSAREPFYRAPPRAVPTPKPAASDDDSGDGS